jgi:primosomal replication protein N
VNLQPDRIPVGVGIAADRVLLQMLAMGGAMQLNSFLSPEEARNVANQLIASAEKIESEGRLVQSIILGNGR